MAIQSLLGRVTPEALEALSADSRVRNSRKIEQHLNAFALHLRGVSDRGVQQELGLGTLSSAQHSIKRGEQLARELGLDTDRIRFKLAAWFEELADLTMQQVRDQVLNGTAVTQVEADGSVSVRRTKHADPRMVGEAGRGLVRMAQFYGLMDPASGDSAPQQTTIISLSAPADGASFQQMCSAAVPEASGQVVDASANPVDGGGVPEGPPQIDVARG